MYKTRKILSVAPPSNLGTLVGRSALIYFFPHMGAFLFVLLINLSHMPLFTLFLLGMFALHLPALLLRRRSRVEIDKKTLQVKWKPTSGVDMQLWKNSLGSLFFFAVMGVFLAIAFH